MSIYCSYPVSRFRRLRQHSGVRRLVADVSVSVDDLIYPVFIVSGSGIASDIPSMPGQKQVSLDRLPELLHEISGLGVSAIMLFGVPESKDPDGSCSWQDDGLIQKACHVVRNTTPEILCIVDVCFCEYTDHGHCGVLYENSQGNLDVDNDATLQLLAKQALSLVKAGAQMIAPSGMLDGMVKTLRTALDDHGFQDIPIMSYSVKYASKLYGPFRDAAQGSPQFGDRSTYQMNPANTKMALREARSDVAEGADIIMVKPAGYYLDIVKSVRNDLPSIPMAAYQVSGEYSMIKAAGQAGWIDEQAMMVESLVAIKRAGADCIITYFALDMARYLKSV